MWPKPIIPLPASATILRYTARMTAQSFWRIVRTNPPGERDFASREQLGHRPRNERPETLRLWSGLSMYATETHARRNARLYPMLGTFLAEVIVSDGDLVSVEKTLGPEHYTLWGTPHMFLDRVVRVVPV